MLVDPSNSSLSAVVTGAIRQAAQATGASFHYLLATAQVESGLNPKAGASTSSAHGLFQFIEQTWLATLKQAGQALGYGRYAAAISESASGRYHVQDPSLRGEILKLRNDPTANAVMAGAFTEANAAALRARLGRSPSDGELYIAHFLGVGGAAQLIKLAAANPSATAAEAFADAAAANRSIFYDSAGAARSAAQVRDLLIARYQAAARRNGGGVVAAATAAPVSASAPPAAAATAAATATAAPDTAGLAEAFAAAIPKPSGADHQIFHGLFEDSQRTSPVSPLALWTTADAGASADSPAAASPVMLGGFLDLFRDPVGRS